MTLEQFPDNLSENQIDSDDLPAIRDQMAEQAAEMNEKLFSDEPVDDTMERRISPSRVPRRGNSFAFASTGRRLSMARILVST